MYIRVCDCVRYKQPQSYPNCSFQNMLTCHSHYFFCRRMNDKSKKHKQTTQNQKWIISRAYLKRFLFVSPYSDVTKVALGKKCVNNCIFCMCLNICKCVIICNICMCVNLSVCMSSLCSCFYCNSICFLIHIYFDFWFFLLWVCN